MLALLGIVSDIVTIASGGVPLPMDQIGRGVASFVRRRKGMTRAKMRKKMAAKKRRFVDTVIMEHERRVQQQNIQIRIDETKARLEKIKKDHEEQALFRQAAKVKSQTRPKNRYGNHDDDYEEDGEDVSGEHLTAVQKIIADKQNNPGENWTNKINNNRGGSARGI